MDELTPVYRVEHFLDTIVNGSANPYDPVYRIEKYLAKIAGEDVEVPTPIYRVEMYLAYLCGMNVTIPEPIYRIEMYLAKKCGMDVETPVPIYRIEYWLDEWANGGSGSLVTITGVSPLALANALAHSIHSLTQYGKCTQETGATPSTPKDIYCNNGALKCSMNMANVNEQTASIGYYINAQGAVLADQYNWFYQAFIPVKPNTAYTLSMSSPVYYVTISEYSTADDGGFIVRKAGSTGGNTSLTITTGANTNYIRFGTNLNRVAVSMDMVLAINWMLNIGGTAMDYQPYVEGGIYADGTPEVLSVSVGANLFDASSYTEINAYVNANTGVLTAGSPGSMTQYCAVIPCKPNAQYNITGQGTSAWGAFPSDSIGTAATKSTKGGILTTGPNDRYLIGLVRANGDTIDYRNTLVVQEVQTVTDIPMLLSVGDDKDALELISGNADKAITVFRVSPDLNWLLASGTGYKQFYTSDTQGQLANSVSCMSNVAPYGCTASNRASYQFGCYTGSTGNLCFQMIGEPDINTVADWKAFLRDNVVYVVAAKAESTTEQTTPHSLHSYNGTTIVTADTNVDPVTLECEYMATQGGGGDGE